MSPFSSPEGFKPAVAGSVPALTPAQEQPERVLVVLPNWVGDVVLATPALRAIRRRCGSARVTFLLKRPLAEVLSGAPWADELVFWPARFASQSRPERHRGFLGLAAELRDRQFDWAVLLTNSFRSALLVRLAGVRRRIGYDRDGRGLLLTDRLLPPKADGRFVPVAMTRYYNAVARYLGCRDCGEQLELFTTDSEEAAALQVVARAGADGGKPIAVLNPGASFGPAKCWLPARFAEVGDALVREHGAAVFIGCGPKETAIARDVATRMREPAVVLDDPVLGLGPMKALLRRAALLVTNDTGPRHFANAFGTPVVTVFGPTDPRWTETASPRERTVMVQVDCGPCMKRRCPLDHRCMTRIDSQMVLQAARALLNGAAQPGAGVS